MKLQNLALAAFAASSAGLLTATFSPMHAATLSGDTCESSSFSYLSCAGAFSGNDKGAQGTGLSNLNSLFGEGWSFVGDNEDGTVSFSSGGDGTKSGTASTNLSGFGAIAVKAGNSYSLYAVEELSEFDWDTLGVTPVGKKGNAPGLSHLSVYQQVASTFAPTEEIPEPSFLLGLVMVTAAGIRLKDKSDRAS